MGCPCSPGSSASQSPDTPCGGSGATSTPIPDEALRGEGGELACGGEQALTLDDVEIARVEQLALHGGEIDPVRHPRILEKRRAGNGVDELPVEIRTHRDVL